MTGQRVRPRARWLSPPRSLRARLVVIMLLLLAVVCLVVGAVTVVSLRGFLLGRLDAQLNNAVSRSTAFAAGRGPSSPDQNSQPRSSGQGVLHPCRQQNDRTGQPDRGGPGFLFAPGQAEGTLGATFCDGKKVFAGVLDISGALHQLADPQVAVLRQLPPDGRIRVRALGALGDYKVVAWRGRDTGEVLVNGVPLEGVHATVGRLAWIVFGVSGAALLLGGVLGIAVIGQVLRPLRRVAATAGRVTGLRLDQGEVALSVRVPPPDTDPRTEVGRVGAALNRMLEHVAAALNARHASETRVRQFVADASHELRTPLAAIRGYAELTRRSRERTPPEVVDALDRMEAASVRMTSLVEDLLLLARLDSGRPLEREPVDLTLLCLESLTDAGAAGPQHRWNLVLPDEPVEVPGDPLRLHQVLANLLTNARTHTPPGTKVELELSTAGAYALLQVRDEGPGIPAELLPDIFGRFVRGDSSRSRAAGSSGLGLAIVAAVVEAHDGTVDVSSSPRGTEFSVRLPMDRPGPDDLSGLAESATTPERR